jgi:hypothetical protein
MPVITRPSDSILGALQLLAKMCGWNEPEKHEIEHGFKAQQDLVEVIARLRGRGAARNFRVEPLFFVLLFEFYKTFLITFRETNV